MIDKSRILSSCSLTSYFAVIHGLYANHDRTVTELTFHQRIDENQAYRSGRLEMRRIDSRMLTAYTLGENGQG
jgi:hypothetical protein